MIDSFWEGPLWGLLEVWLAHNWDLDYLQSTKKILCCVQISDGAILSKSGIRPLAVQVPGPSDWPVTLPCFNVIGQPLSGLSGFNWRDHIAVKPLTKYHFMAIWIEHFTSVFNLMAHLLKPFTVSKAQWHSDSRAYWATGDLNLMNMEPSRRLHSTLSLSQNSYLSSSSPIFSDASSSKSTPHPRQ